MPAWVIIVDISAVEEKQYGIQLYEQGPQSFCLPGYEYSNSVDLGYTNTLDFQIEVVDCWNP